MLIVMRKTADSGDIERVIEVIRRLGYQARPIPGLDRTAIGIVGNDHAIDPSPFLSLPGVKEAIPVTKPYKLVSKEFHPLPTIVNITSCGRTIGIGNGSGLVVIGGPCAVESEGQLLETAHAVKEAGGHILRGGAYKPRTSPYSFQGLGEKGLKILARAREDTGLAIVSEALDHVVYDLVEEYCDIVQIGARNMQNFSLLRRAGRSDKPVLLKRGMSATVEEWLMAAEYIVSEGNPRVILCERGIRTFCKHSRNTLDLSAVLFLLKETHLPVIVDPSHACGVRDQVIPLSKAACVIGAHGIMVEVHPEPEKALSDGPQSLNLQEFALLMKELEKVQALCGDESSVPRIGICAGSV
ncbi:3-deoxy-7-phosphoheptulonate synthase [Thermodesulforhabdus norvegica]|uniref:3-deoxy-D-arabinoheptulosonate-7-phosphate synthase n=1 Tax=Thermodesulforhabdus norvegica TaxID=39841 RepID=A0A1I4U719_9BACT|nr:3-deoxy-7-phosphoheptulonate synthase [Thermodesulforhabdus norvegica]SFM84533.1 3-deoxy-D-arabinoheptulosonate-7-phosphate synthase [Thermodesulforhabdus norvegica]